MSKATMMAVLLALGTTTVLAATNKTFHGEIMDSACAKAGNHNAGFKMSGTKTAKDCTLACTKAGSEFVLYDPATKKTYKLDDQTKPEAFAGKRVTVTGSYSAADQTIHVVKIKG